MMKDREKTASSIIGFGVEHKGTYQCPFRHLHSTRNGNKDFRVMLDGAPTVSCLHSSCQHEIEALNLKLRRGIAIEESGGTFRNDGAYKIHAAERQPAPKVEFNEPALLKIFRQDFASAAWFKGRSPVDPEHVTPESFLSALYYPGEKVLVFTSEFSQGDYGFFEGQFWRLGQKPGAPARKEPLPRSGHKKGVWFLVQPVGGTWEPTRGAREVKLSRRSETNVTRWPFMVLEHDPPHLIFFQKAKGVSEDVANEHRKQESAEWLEYLATEDCRNRENRSLQLWLSFLAQLPAPIAAIYTSGGKSIHALLKLDFTETKQQWDLFKNNMKPLFAAFGADPAALSAVRLSRLPGCTRPDKRTGKAKLQRLLYLNPSPDPTGVPICGTGGNLIIQRSELSKSLKPING